MSASPLAAPPEYLRSVFGADAIDTGLDKSGVFTNDIDDEIRPMGGGWDIGADEITECSATIHYRSIGTQTGDLYNIGTADATNGSTTVTFSGATLPGRRKPGNRN